MGTYVDPELEAAYCPFCGYDNSGMLVVPTSVLDSWKQEVNHEETCNKCGYTWMSKARFHMTRTCPRCKEVIY